MFAPISRQTRLLFLLVILSRFVSSDEGSLFEWLRNSVGASTAPLVADGDGALRAAEPLPAGSLLLHLPARGVVRASAAGLVVGEPLPPVGSPPPAAVGEASAARLRAVWRALAGAPGAGGASSALAVWLMRERALAALNASLWAPFLASLARSGGAPPLHEWATAERALLQDPALEASAATQHKETLDTYRMLVPHIDAAFAEFPAALQPRDADVAWVVARCNATPAEARAALGRAPGRRRSGTAPSSGDGGGGCAWSDGSPRALSLRCAQGGGLPTFGCGFNTFASFSWARSTVATRAFNNFSGKTLLLLPLLATLPHAPPPRSAPPPKLPISHDNGSVTLISDRALASGDAVVSFFAPTLPSTIAGVMQGALALRGGNASGAAPLRGGGEPLAALRAAGAVAAGAPPPPPLLPFDDAAHCTRLWVPGLDVYPAWAATLPPPAVGGGGGGAPPAGGEDALEALLRPFSVAPALPPLVRAFVAGAGASAPPSAELVAGRARVAAALSLSREKAQGHCLNSAEGLRDASKWLAVAHMGPREVALCEAAATLAGSGGGAPSERCLVGGVEEAGVVAAGGLWPGDHPPYAPAFHSRTGDAARLVLALAHTLVGGGPLHSPLGNTSYAVDALLFAAASAWGAEAPEGEGGHSCAGGGGGGGGGGCGCGEDADAGDFGASAAAASALALLRRLSDGGGEGRVPGLLRGAGFVSRGTGGCRWAPSRASRLALAWRVAAKGSLWALLQRTVAGVGAWHAVPPAAPAPERPLWGDADCEGWSDAGAARCAAAAESPRRIGHALLPPRAAALFTTDATVAALARACAAFNEWWAARGGGGDVELVPAGGAARVGVFPLRGGGGGGGGGSLQVPPSAQMSADSAARCPVLGPPLAALHASGLFDARHELIFHLLREADAGARSAWAPYIATLPPREALLAPLLATRSELGALAGSAALPIVLRARAEAAVAYFETRRAVLDAFPNVLTGDATSFAAYSWAAATVDGRALWGDAREGPLLLPMLDAAAFSAPRALGGGALTRGAGGGVGGGPLERSPPGAGDGGFFHFSPAPAHGPPDVLARAHLGPTLAGFLRTGVVPLPRDGAPASDDCAVLHLPLPSRLRTPLRVAAARATAEELERLAAVSAGLCDVTATRGARGGRAACGPGGAPRAGVEALALWGVGDAVLLEVEAAGEAAAPFPPLSAAAARLEDAPWWWRPLLLPAGGGGGGGAPAPNLAAIAARELARGWASAPRAAAAAAAARDLPAGRAAVAAAAARLAAADAAPPDAVAPLTPEEQGLMERASQFTGAAELCVRPLPSRSARGGGGGGGGGARAAPRHAETDEALDFLSRAYNVSRRGAGALLAGAARARLRAFPTTLGADVAALVADAAAAAALALETPEEASTAVAALLGGVYGRAGGASPCGGGGDGPSAALFGDSCGAHFDLALHSFVSGEGAGAVEAGLAAARRALLPPRERHARRLLANEKQLLAALAGWEYGAEGEYRD